MNKIVLIEYNFKFRLINFKRDNMQSIYYFKASENKQIKFETIIIVNIIVQKPI